MSQHDNRDVWGALWRDHKAAYILIKLGYLLHLGFIRKTSHKRDYSRAPQVLDTLNDDPLAPVEYKDADEDALFHDISMSFASDCVKQNKGVGHNKDFEDEHWGLTKGLVEGQLQITDTDVLPKQCRAGLFAKNGEYRVVSRPNFLHDHAHIKVSRLSLKLEQTDEVPNVYSPSGTAKELDLLFSEGVLSGQTNDQDGQGFFFSDARQMNFIKTLQSSPMKALWALLFNSGNGEAFFNWKKLTMGATDTLYGAAQAQRNWAEKHYFSAGPFALGDGLMKVALISRQQGNAPYRHPGENPAYDQRTWFNEWQQAGEDAVFDLCIQIARPSAIPEPDPKHDPCKAVMATEYTHLVWDETTAPFQKVGTLTLRATTQQSNADPWYFQARDRWYPDCGPTQPALRFSAWNTFDENRPLGQLFRARKLVHTFYRETRLRHSLTASKDSNAYLPAPTEPAAEGTSS